MSISTLLAKLFGGSFFQKKPTFSKKVIHGYSVVHRPDINWAYAVMTETHGQEIWVGDYFFKLSETCQKFVLAHEQGHIDNNDFIRGVLSSDRLGYILRNEVCPFELGADWYAAGIVGIPAAIEALNELKGMLGDSLGAKEIDLRINYLYSAVTRYAFMA